MRYYSECIMEGLVKTRSALQEGADIHLEPDSRDTSTIEVPGTELTGEVKTKDVRTAERDALNTVRGRLGMPPSEPDSLEREGIHPDLEGDPTLTLFDRMNTPAIIEQRITLLEQSERAKAIERRQYWKTLIAPDGLPEEDENGNPKKVWIDELVHPAYTPKTREELAREYAERLSAVTKLGGDKTVTYLYRRNGLESEGSHLDHDVDEVVIDREERFGGLEAHTQRTLAIVLSHEKLHQLCPESSTYLDTQFRDLIDARELKFTQQEYERNVQSAREDSRTIEEFNKRLAEYLDAREILARMSQLKNYFGLHGAEPFTQEHLAYARAHYVKDTGLDNHMSVFFRAITPEKEVAFINGMNTLGV